MANPANPVLATKVTIKGRISFPNVFKPKKVGNSTEEKYSLVVFFPKDDAETFAAVKAALKAAAEAGKESKWGGKIPSSLISPLKDGDNQNPDDDDDKKVYPELEGSYYINLTANTKPGVVKKVGGLFVEVKEEENLIYAGAHCAVSVNFFPYSSNGNKGVSGGLNNVLFWKHGEPLGGRVSADVDFKDIALESELDEAPEEKPTKAGKSNGSIFD